MLAVQFPTEVHAEFVVSPLNFSSNLFWKLNAGTLVVWIFWGVCVNEELHVSLHGKQATQCSE